MSFLKKSCIGMTYVVMKNSNFGASIMTKVCKCREIEGQEKFDISEKYKEVPKT